VEQSRRNFNIVSNLVTMVEITQPEGKRAFGADPAGYHEARPGYPEKVFDILRDRCGIRSGSRVFEVGPGTGIASQKLLQLGANPLVLIEPDERLGNFLGDTIARSSPSVKLTVTTFEQAELPAGWFDIGASASAFHWLDEMTSLHKISRVLRPGGWWAVWWNLFFGAPRDDEFYKASQAFLDGLDLSPSSGREGRPAFALDTETRIANLRLCEFENIEVESVVWAVTLDTARMIKLYRTFSPISRLAAGDQQRLLDNLAQLAEKQFGGEVEIRITTPIYTAQVRA
jgi:SAM-dependent methyltransferase